MTEVKYNENEISKLANRIKANNQFFSVKLGETTLISRTNDVERFNELADFTDNADVFWVQIYKNGDEKHRIFTDRVGLVVNGIKDGLGRIHSEASITDKIKEELRREFELEALKKDNAKLEEEVKNLLIEIGEKDEIIANGGYANMVAKGLGEVASIVLAKNPQLAQSLGGFLGAGQPTSAPEQSEEERFLTETGRELFESFVPAQNFDFFKTQILPFIKQDNLLLNDIYALIQKKYGQQQN